MFETKAQLRAINTVDQMPRFMRIFPFVLTDRMREAAKTILALDGHARWIDTYEQRVRDFWIPRLGESHPNVRVALLRIAALRAKLEEAARIVEQGAQEAVQRGYLIKTGQGYELAGTTRTVLATTIAIVIVAVIIAAIIVGWPAWVAIVAAITGGLALVALAMDALQGVTEGTGPGAKGVGDLFAGLGDLLGWLPWLAVGGGVLYVMKRKGKL